MGRRIAYIRVSTEEQRPDRQIDGLRPHCDELRIEQGVSATAKKRPVFDDLLEDLKPGDTLVLWALDRAFRSTAAATTTLNVLRERGVHICILALGIDTATPVGRFQYALMAALAEFERETLSERTKQGLAAARRRGVILGRPRALTNAQVAELKRTVSLDPTRTLEGLAADTGCSRHTISRALHRTPKVR